VGKAGSEEAVSGY